MTKGLSKKKYTKMSKTYWIEGLNGFERTVISSNDNLSRYLFNLTQEVPTTKRSWLYEDEDPESVLERWKSILERLETGNSYEQEVYQFDISSEEKWGPQGGHAPISELMEDVILPTFTRPMPRPSVFDFVGATREWVEAMNQVDDEYRRHGIRGLRPAAYTKVLDDMRARDVLESNSGWPCFARRNIPEVKEHALKSVEDGSYTNYPAIALIRYYRKKARLVWMFPMATNVKEGTYYQPLQNAVVKSKIDFYAPWIGFERVREMITKAYDSGKVIAASDFSSTDAHFQLDATWQVHHVLANTFNEVYTIQQGLAESLDLMHSIPLIIGPDKKIIGSHGVSSGSNWTNFVETVFDHIFAKFVALQTKYTGFYAIGDDMTWVSDQYDEDFNQQLESLGVEVGQVIKADKTTNSPDKVKTLQRLFQRGYKRPDGLERGVYPTIRALNSSIYPERFHKPKLWSSDMFCARQYMILENCVDHPLFEEFVSFVVHGQKDLIPFAKKSKRELDDILRKSKLVPGLNPTYNQERRDHSLADFEAIRIAQNL